jgi:hypothetical protein
MTASELYLALTHTVLGSRIILEDEKGRRLELKHIKSTNGDETILICKSIKEDNL